VIKSFRHKGLKRYYQKGDARALPPHMLPRLRMILADLDAAESPEEMDVPGYRLHELKGNLRGSYSVRVARNFRVTFRFEKTEPWDVDFVDYH